MAAKSVIRELAQYVVDDNAVLFLGSELLAEEDKETTLPSHKAIAKILAERFEYHRGDLSLPSVARDFEVLHGHHGLIEILLRILNDPRLSPTSTHRLIAKAARPFSKIVTTNYDVLLEQVLRDMRKRYVLIIRDADVPFFDETRITLIKMQGDITQPDSLVITADDVQEFLNRLPTLSDVIRAFFATKTLIFVGYDLEDDNVKRLFSQLTPDVGRFRRTAYAVSDKVLPPADAKWWQAGAVEILKQDTVGFLEALTAEIERMAVVAPSEPTPPPPTDIPVPEQPYKFLEPFERTDAAIFFGRKEDSHRLANKILANRLVVLYGESGAGKTSLLQAGVIPLLEREHALTVVIRPGDDPIGAVYTALQSAVDGARLPEPGSDLLPLLQQAEGATDKLLVIVLDQFEEFFLHLGEGRRQAFVEQLARCCHSPSLDARLVISLRDDFLSRLHTFEAALPTVLNHRYHLERLGRENAREAIVEPLREFHVCFDDPLVEKLLDDLYEEGVAPPQLQIVCHRLYQEYGQPGRTVTLADYEGLSGAQGILAGYIEAALRGHPGEEREVAKGVLMALVTSQATKAWTDLGNITAEVGAEEAAVERVLSRLTAQRLVRRLDEGRGYELTHDVLAATIGAWISEEDRQLKRVRELLRRELADWQQDPTALLSQSKFQRINALRDSLRLTDEETAFLLRTAVRYGEDVPYWLEQVGEPDAQADILLEMLVSEAHQARLTAAQYLAGFPKEQVATALAHAALEDAEPAVRDMGAVSLGWIEGHAGVRLLLETAQTKGSLQRMRAVRALALIQDVTPDLFAGVVGPVRRQVYYELAKIRFWRAWPRVRMVTTAGAIGTAVGFAVGLTPPVILNIWDQYGDLGEAISSVPITALLLALLGLLAGAAMVLGITVGESLLKERAAIGRVLGGTLLGGLGFAAVMSPLVVGGTGGLQSVVIASVGSGLFGMMTALGVTAPAAIRPKRAVVLGGGVIGAALGVVVLSAMGFPPVQAIPAPVLLTSGGLVGLAVTFSIASAEARWPVEENGKQRDE